MVCMWMLLLVVAVLERNYKSFGEKGKLFAFDQDLDALKMQLTTNDCILINENFRYIKQIFLRFTESKQVDGIWLI